MKQIFIPVILFYSSFVQADSYTLTHEEWSVPRSANVILGMPVIHSAINELNQAEQSRVILHYPGGDTGSLWMNELKSWLVALGVPENRIESVPGTEEKQTLKLEVIL